MQITGQRPMPLADRALDKMIACGFARKSAAFGFASKFIDPRATNSYDQGPELPLPPGSDPSFEPAYLPMYRARIQMRYSSLKAAFLFVSMVLIQFSTAESSLGQNFVEYPNQNQTYGDHTLNSSWVGGPTNVTVTFDSDDLTLHEDGVGSSQRTTRNTQNFVGPSDATNPQNYDNLDLIGVYGSRLPLIQQMSSNGTSTLTYAFDDPVNVSLDLFITDVDNSDFATVRAFDDQNVAIDMQTWTLVDEGDLSVFKDTGTAFSSIVAPTPTTVFQANEISLTAIDDSNYNRSYSILRNPLGQNLSRIEITFTGTQNSPNRANPNTGSHIYTALTTAVPEPSSAMLLFGFCVVAGTGRRRFG